MSSSCDEAGGICQMTLRIKDPVKATIKSRRVLISKLASIFRDKFRSLANCITEATVQLPAGGESNARWGHENDLQRTGSRFNSDADAPL